MDVCINQISCGLKCEASFIYLSNCSLKGNYFCIVWVINTDGASLMFIEWKSVEAVNILFEASW
jgi:hypothetical protein